LSFTLLRFYQAYCTHVMRNCWCYVTGGVLINFLISRSTGVSIATAKTKTAHSTSDLLPKHQTSEIYLKT